MCLFQSDRVVHTRHGESKVVTTKCGKCVDCLKERQNAWKLRLCKESEQWNHIYFFTLTYRDDTLPCRVIATDEPDSILYEGSVSDCESYWQDRLSIIGSLANLATHCLSSEERESLMYHHDFAIVSTVRFIDVQLYIKRIRAAYEYDFGTTLDMKYFICSEYGGDFNATRRPHYHGIVYSNACFDDLAPLFRTWESDFGRMEFKEVTSTSRADASAVANYVSKYCAKGEFNTRKEDIEHGFADIARFSCSQGLGIEFCDNVLKPELYAKIPLSLEIENSTKDIILREDDISNFFAIADNNDTVNPASYSGICPLTKKLTTFGREGKLSSTYVAKVREEIDNLCSNLLVYDGLYGYKMPRAYFQRLFCRKIHEVRYMGTSIPSLHLSLDVFFAEPDLCYFTNLPKPLEYEVKEIKCVRYVQENFLSLAIAHCLRERAFARLCRAFGDGEASHKQTSVFCKELGKFLNREELSKFYRFQESTSSLYNFYFSNEIKNQL